MPHAMKCGDLMTKGPVCCLPDDPVDKAARLMKSANVGPIPVVDDMRSHRLVGIVTDRDLALSVVAEGRDPRKTKVAEVMHQDLVTCRVDDDVENVLDVMADKQVRRIPVIDDGGCICGIISQADIATRLHEPDRTGKVVEGISQ